MSTRFVLHQPNEVAHPSGYGKTVRLTSGRGLTTSGRTHVVEIQGRLELPCLSVRSGMLVQLSYWIVMERPGEFESPSKA